jgi:beta-lactamase regulating signal transducer with metallopeptidase domain
MMALDFQSVAQIAASRGLNTVLEGLALAGLSWGVLRGFGGRSSAVNAMTRFAVWFSTLLVIAGLPLLTRTGSTLDVASVHRPELTVSSVWAAWLFGAWAVIASGLLIRLGFSLWHVHALRRECREIDGDLHPALKEVAEEFLNGKFQGTRRVKLLVSEDVRVPTALGFFRPAVVLPSWTLRDLSADELKAIVLHELAHLRRWDDWTNLAQKFLKVLFFFHPAVWWIDSRLALEREIACDDMVLEQTANAKTYAASLVSVAEKVVAEKMRMGRALALAQSALGRMREVSQRIAQILDPKRPRSNGGWRPAVAMIGTLAVVTLGAMPYAPELISFQTKAEPAFWAAADGVGSVPVKVTPASLHWTGEDPSSSLRTGPSASLRAGARRTTGKNSPMMIRAKARLHEGNQRRNVVMGKASDYQAKVVMAKATDSTQPAQTMLIWHTTQFNEANSTVWTLTVWRVRSADGEQQTLQETIVMNSL